MEIKAYKCEYCDKIYEDESMYEKCKEKCSGKCNVRYELEFSDNDEGCLQFNYDDWKNILNENNKDIFYLCINTESVGMSEKQLEDLVDKLKKIQGLYRSKRLLKIWEKI